MPEAHAHAHTHPHAHAHTHAHAHAHSHAHTNMPMHEISLYLMIGLQSIKAAFACDYLVYPASNLSVKD